MYTIALIIFPGTNCELEAFRACERAGLKPSFVRWNESSEVLRDFDAFLLPGGFSYEDRGRSGVIAAQDAIMAEVIKAATAGKPVLGICNGAQMLVEAALVPGIHRSAVPEDTTKVLEMSLTWNERLKDEDVMERGYYNDWIYIRSDVPKGRSFFNRFDNDLIMRIAVANGEGKFIANSPELLDILIKNQQTVFRYCDADGNISPNFPVNPNNALYNLAGICNPEGNVLALMPHPERSLSGQPIFDSLAASLEEKQPLYSLEKAQLQEQGQILALQQDSLTNKPKPDFSIMVELIITDNEERTLENTLKKMQFTDYALQRRILYNFYLSDTSKYSEEELKKIAQQIIESGELINLHKEIPKLLLAGATYSYEKERGFIPDPSTQHPEQDTHYSFYVVDRDNYAGMCVQKKLASYLPEGILSKVEKGVLWTVKKIDNTSYTSQGLQQILQTHLFHNPHAMEVVAF